MGKGNGKQAKSRGKGKQGKQQGTWMFVPQRGSPKFAPAKGKGKSGKSSKFLDKLAKIEAPMKVWIGGLDAKTNWKALEKHVQEIVGEKPSITEILPKGKACLAFKTEGDADSARSLLNDTELQGKTVVADVWTQKERKEKPEGGKKRDKKLKQSVLKTGFAKRAALAKTGKGGKASRSDPKLREKMDKIDNELKVWVGGLKTETTPGQIRKCFAEAGHKPHHINLTGKDKACVSFKTADEASGAIGALNGVELAGSVLEVDVWKQATEEERAARREERKARIEAAKAEKKAAKAA